MTLRNVVKTLMVAMTASIFGACSESYPGSEEYDHTQGLPGIKNEDTWSEQIPVMLFVNEQNVFAVKTRGAGAIEGSDTNNVKRMEQAIFHVFAFRDGLHGVFENHPNALLNSQPNLQYYVNAKDNVPSNLLSLIDTTNNVNCLLDGKDYKFGLPTMLKGGQLYPRRFYKGETLDTTFYYSWVNQEVPYNFFAFHIDDIDPTNGVTEIRQADKIVYKFQIDGSQDVLYGVSDDLRNEIEKEEPERVGKDDTYANYLNKVHEAWKRLSKAEKEKIYDIGGYCTFTAHRNIHPVIDMEHALTRLKFKAYAADPKAKDVTVTRVQVKSMYKATLTAAARKRSEVGIVFDSLATDRTYLTLQEVKNVGGKMTALPFESKLINYKPADEAYDWYERTPTDLGSSLLVAPDSVYALRMEFSAPKSDGTVAIGHTEVPIRLDHNGTMFEKGNEYVIQVAVYGIQEIDVKANLPGWKEHDPIVIDPDKEGYTGFE